MIKEIHDASVSFKDEGSDEVVIRFEAVDGITYLHVSVEHTKVVVAFNERQFEGFKGIVSIIGRSGSIAEDIGSQLIQRTIN